MTMTDETASILVVEDEVIVSGLIAAILMADQIASTRTAQSNR